MRNISLTDDLLRLRGLFLFPHLLLPPPSSLHTCTIRIYSFFLVFSWLVLWRSQIHNTCPAGSCWRGGAQPQGTNLQGGRDTQNGPGESQKGQRNGQNDQHNAQNDQVQTQNVQGYAKYVQGNPQNGPANAQNEPGNARTTGAIFCPKQNILSLSFRLVAKVSSVHHKNATF